ncbi:uncharacterized protein [Antedon mediterranea]|uniref:uncharacterized protein n=1 Tax=Antedon mediterranea TaxID=105859 RepID=UPI003AF5D493
MKSYSFDYLQHVITPTRCSVDHNILMILDNHKLHISIQCIDTAKENGVVLLTLPPHTSHRLQPLDVSWYGSFKRTYAVAMDNWMRSNTGKTLTIYEIPVLVKEAQLSAMVPRNVISGFSNTGIYPFNSDCFTESDYAPATVTDRELPEDHQVDGVS